MSYGGGALIPFCSIYGAPLSTDDTGGSELGLLIGSCAAAQSILIGPSLPVVGSYIDNYAFSMPRDGNITALNVVLNILGSVDLGGNVAVVKVQLWRGAFTTDTYTPLDGTCVTFELSGYVEYPTILVHTVVPPVPVAVTPGERLTLVACMTVNGEEPKQTVHVKVSAGLAID